MSYTDVRKPLPIGTILISSNGDEYTICEENAGRGGNSLIYSAKKKNSERTFIIKECFPLDDRYLFDREASGAIVPHCEENENAKYFLKKQFEHMQEECILGQKIAEGSGRSIAPMETVDISKMLYLGVETPVKPGAFIIMEQYVNKSLHISEILEKYKGISMWVDPIANSINHDGRPDASIILNIICEILKAVKTLHREGYIHGDIHLNNFLFVEPFLEYGDIGVAHLIDFSSARKLHLSNTKNNILETEEIVTQELFTTDGYTAPEIIFNNDGHLKLTPATDVYSVGCLLMVLVKGTKWLNSRIEKRRRQSSKRPAIDITDNITSRELNFTGLDTSVLNKLNLIIKKALRNNPEQRYSDAGEMLKEIEQLYDQVTKALVIYYRRKEIESVGHYNLWQSSKRWIEAVRSGMSRFSGYKIVEHLLPTVTPQERLLAEKSLPIYVRNQENKTTSIVDAIKSTKSNLYLIGEGGIGKTTSLIHIMESEYVGKKYNPKAIVPIFIELSNAPDSYDEKVYRNNAASFIRRSVYDLLLQRVREEQGHIKESSFHDNEVVEKIDQLFSVKNDNPEYLLLLDGLNEVSRIDFEGYSQSPLNKIIREIQCLMAKPNVRVVLTSRTEERMMLTEGGIEELLITGLNERMIREYLFDDPDLEKVIENSNLLEILKIPFFLHLYRSIKTKRKMDVCTQGELLRIFFHERSSDATFYTEQAQAKHIQNDLFMQKEQLETIKSQTRVDEMMHCFILDFILPEIGWYMEREHIYHLDQKKISIIIEKVLTRTTDKNFGGESAELAFSIKYREQYNYGLQKIAETIKKIGTENILDYCVNTLRILKEHYLHGLSDGKYEFLHQHFRDYFASVKCINDMFFAVFLLEQKEKQSTALEIMNDFGDKPISNEISRFIGEYLTEYKNTPYCDNGKWIINIPAYDRNRQLITKSLNVYRGFLNGEVRYGVYNLVKLLIDSRNSLAAVDFSRIDLRECELNSIDLYDADFSRSLFNHYTIFSSEHSSVINCVAYSRDGHFYFTGAADGTLQMRNSDTNKLIITVKQYTSGIEALDVYNTENLYTIAILTTDSMSTKETEIITLVKNEANDYKVEAIHPIKYFGRGRKVLFSPDGKYLVVNTAMGIRCLAADENWKCIAKFGTLDDNMVGGILSKTLAFHPNGKKITFIGNSYIYFKRQTPFRVLSDESENFIDDLDQYKEKHGLWTFDLEKKVYVNYEPLPFDNTHTDIQCITYGVTGNLFIISKGKDVWTFNLIKYDRQYLTFEKNVIRISLIKKDEILVVGTESGKIYFFKLHESKPLLICTDNILHSFVMDISTYGNRMLVCTGNGELAIWNLDLMMADVLFTGNWKDRIKGYTHPKDSSLVMLSGIGGYIQLWNKNDRKVMKINEEYTTILDSQFSPDGDCIIASDGSGNLHIYSEKYDFKDCIFEDVFGAEWCEEIIMNPVPFDNKYIFATISSSHNLKIHCFLVDECKLNSIDLEIGTTRPVFSVNGQHLYVCTNIYRNQLLVIEMATFQIIKEYSLPSLPHFYSGVIGYPLYVIAVSTDEEWIVLERRGPVRYVYNVKENRYLTPLETMVFFKQNRNCEMLNDFSIFHLPVAGLKEMYVTLYEYILLKLKNKERTPHEDIPIFTMIIDKTIVVKSNFVEIWDSTKSTLKCSIPITNYLCVRGAKFYDLNPRCDLEIDDLATIECFGGRI